ncbi:MAG: AmmeMemoRadiSam system radical SAM enzyme [Candidatus Omnitrophica bacterium]|nr:AmmeMemoRadiSam system radical SAM enzyme [Candidatus Omnitrophota bacterium]
MTPLLSPKIQCTLCPNLCVMGDYERGKCRVRINQGGELFSLVYGKPCAVHVDPMEKKPLYHFLPGTGILSIATAGCLLSCKYCQNWEISQAWPEETRNLDLPPKDVVDAAIRSGSRSIAYTYTEPTVFYEYMWDTCALAHERGLRNVYVTCGYINPEPLRELAKVMDAANVDLKGFTEAFYLDVSGGHLQPVLDAILLMKELGMHVELTNLIVPTKNDDPKMIREMSQWIAKYAGGDTPLHFSRFYPNYRYRNLPPTPLEILVQAREIAMEEGIRYVYVGNVPGSDYNSTYCPSCRKRLIHRIGYEVLSFEIDPETSACRFCGTKINGVWK